MIDVTPDYPFSYSDAGRSGSRRPRQRNDCTVRALALACGLAYDDAFDLLRAAGRKSGSRFQFAEWIKKAEIPGWRFEWQPFPAAKGQRRMNPVSFCARYQEGTYILRLSKHVAVVRDGVLLDDSPPLESRCIYGAWRVLAQA